MPTDQPDRPEHDAQEYTFQVTLRRMRHAACPPHLPWWRRWCVVQATGRVLWAIGEAVISRLVGKG